MLMENQVNFALAASRHSERPINIHHRAISNMLLRVHDTEKSQKINIVEQLISKQKSYLRTHYQHCLPGEGEFLNSYHQARNSIYLTNELAVFYRYHEDIPRYKQFLFFDVLDDFHSRRRNQVYLKVAELIGAQNIVGYGQEINDGSTNQLQLRCQNKSFISILPVWTRSEYYLEFEVNDNTIYELTECLLVMKKERSKIVRNNTTTIKPEDLDLQKISSPQDKRKKSQPQNNSSSPGSQKWKSSKPSVDTCTNSKQRFKIKTKSQAQSFAVKVPSPPKSPKKSGFKISSPAKSRSKFTLKTQPAIPPKHEAILVKIEKVKRNRKRLLSLAFEV